MKFKDWLDEFQYKVIQGSLDIEVTEVVYDSRKAVEGGVFVCMKGTKIDSHQFVSQVVKDGIKAVVVEEHVEVPEGITVIWTEDTRKALACLSAARFGYPAKRMTTIGVTGTKGKTTTTHMIKSILEHGGKKTGMIGTTGIVIGSQVIPTVNTTPESYELQKAFWQMAEAGCEYLVMEVASQAFKMNRVYGIHFDYGIFTNISPDHIGPDEHENFEEYLLCKSCLFQQCDMGIFNADDIHCQEVAANASCQIHYFSTEGKGDLNASHIKYVSEPDFVGVEFLLQGDLSFQTRMNIPGKFNVSNGLAAISVCNRLGVTKEHLQHGLEHLNINGRMEIVSATDIYTVIVDYAHNAVSMESLLQTLREYKPTRLVCVFGCGGNRAKDRRYSMGEIAGKLSDFSILTADNSRYEKTEDIIADIRGCLEKTGGRYLEIPDRREAIEYSIMNAEKGDMIAVIGKGHEDYQEINGQRFHFSDREVILETVNKCK